MPMPRVYGPCGYLPASPSPDQVLQSLHAQICCHLQVAALYVFGTGLVAYLLLQRFITRNHWW